MGRPEHAPRSAAGKSGTVNPLRAWLDERKERKKQLEEEAARAIYNETIGTESAIIRELELVDFEHSKLPSDVLEAKTMPDQRCCDLELMTRHLIHELQNDTHPIKADIRKIDEQLWKLAKLLRQAVDQGDAEAASAAKTGLAFGIKKIRFRIPDSQPEFLKDFVALNARYLDEWVTLVNMSQVIDKETENLKSMRDQVDKDRKAVDQEREAFLQRLESDGAYRAAYQQIRDFSGDADPMKWTSQQRQMRQDMIRGSLARSMAALNEALLLQQETKLDIKRSNRDTLFKRLNEVPVFEDPNLMNKFKDSLERIYDDMAKADQEIDESIKVFDDMRGRIQQFAYTPGAVRANQLAQEQAELMGKELQAMQQAESDSNKGVSMRDLGFMTSEEVEQVKELARQATAQTERQAEKQRLYES